MSVTEVLTLVAIFLGPISAVGVTLWWQRRTEQHDAKMKLFLTLMAHRKQFPPSSEWVDSLNVIDVVFSRNPKILELWHRYYDQLHLDAATSNYQARDHAYLLMLAAMARTLGYRELEITDIDKFYSPMAHGEQHQLTHNIQAELLRVLTNTNTLVLDRSHEEHEPQLVADAPRPHTRKPK